MTSSVKQANDRQEQTLSVNALPISMANLKTNNETVLSLTSGIDSNQRIIQNKQPIKIFKKNPLDKLKHFLNQYKKLFILIWQSIIPDLKCFLWWQVVLLLLFAIFNVIFSILDFNALFPSSQNLSLLRWTNDTRAGIELWRRILLCLSGVAAFTNVLNVVLVIKGKISAYFWGIIGSILYGSFAFAYGYVGDAQLYVLFFLPMQFVGIYTWSNALDQESTTRIRSLTLLRWIIAVVLIVGLGFLFFYEIPAFARALTGMYAFESDIAPHILDASTNAISFVGQFLLIFCYWEQYICWLFANIIGIVMYSGALNTGRDINVLMVWIMFAINSIIGLITWFRRWTISKRIPKICKY